MNDEWNAIFERTVEGGEPQRVHTARVKAAREIDALNEAAAIGVEQNVDCDTIRVVRIDDSRGFILSESKLSGGDKLS